MNRRIWLAPGQYPRVDKNFARLILFLRIENSDRKHSIDRVEIYQYHMARIYILESFQNSALVGAEKKRANSIQVVVIGRDFPSSHGTMHPVAQFNITYAYSIVSRRRRRNRKGLCTPARFARDAQEGQKLVLHSNFLSPIPLLWKLPREQPSFHQVALLDDYAAIYRDLSRHGLPAELATLVSHAVDRVGGYTHFRNLLGVYSNQVWILKNFVCTSKGKISLWISFHRSSRSSGSIGALKMWHRLNEISKFRADETSSKRFFPPPLGRGKTEKHSLVFLEIDFFGENERKEHRDGGIIFLSAVHVESRRSFGESGGGTRTRRSVTFLFIRSSRRRLPGPDNEWMSKTQQLIQPRGEQRRKNTVVVVVVLERSSSSTRDPTKEEGVCKWGEPASRGKKKGDNWQWGSNGREGTMVGSSNFTLLIVIQFHGASGSLCLLVSLSLSPSPSSMSHSTMPFLSNSWTRYFSFSSRFRIIFVRPCWKPLIDRKSEKGWTWQLFNIFAYNSDFAADVAWSLQPREIIRRIAYPKIRFP